MRLLALTLLCGMAGASSAQGTISIFGQFTIQEGGTAFVSSRARETAGGPIGSFMATFSEGSIASVQTLHIETMFVPGITAGFDAIATAQLRAGSTTRAVTGRIHVYVDDLSGVTPPMPDQMIFTFQPPVGTLIVRHGRITRGDIAVSGF